MNKQDVETSMTFKGFSSRSTDTIRRKSTGSAAQPVTPKRCMRFSRTHLVVRRCYLPTSKRASPQSGNASSNSPPATLTMSWSPGHGTETHELVGHDTDPYDLARTTIPLTTLGEWCSRIPSRRLLIVLDCCFSGGMGAKALQVEAVPRDIQSVDGKLNQISGEGRVVLTACGPMQRAWESPKLGPGFLSLHMIEGLQGPEEIREGGRIAVLRLLDYVVGRVVDSARQIRREQRSQALAFSR